ncbi:TIGR04348 family glycosyltransferase [Aquincola sp. S2]|uniref:TIGR04348 family glycosyltransferase n=1 Tax=Pseudaquabacterium terrae TaxID=2732868 RepID=A0ABX2ESZ0_9BURK|nr:selenoneine biosynthesis selenosugar synthase SenB [Aquabacterium terrae]NRF71620.1 TIGR04348 family glycosyltransferase [Aquabacterium terrae]
MVRPGVIIVSPAAAADNNGNWYTAARWRDFLQPAVQASVTQQWVDEPADALIALHARKSAPSIERFRAARPGGPIALVLTGTDLYRDIATSPQAQRSLDLADHLIVLQPLGLMRLSGAQRAKARVIVQSAPLGVPAAVAGDRPPVFVAVGHLRAEKDPLTLMEAARSLDPKERVHIDHIGAALDPGLADAARQTMSDCPHYRWLGGLSHDQTLSAIAGATALVHMSRLEGGAHVVIEAVRAGLPVIASRIDGNVGLLGEDYEGYFPAGDAQTLAAALRRFQADAAWAARLRRQCAERAQDFAPEREAAAVQRLVADMLAAGS